jgi:FtsZ-interacting cell division protein YlmF
MGKYIFPSDEKIITSEEIKISEGSDKTRVFQPKTFYDAKTIVDSIMDGKNVIINLESLISLEKGVETANKILIYLSGAIQVLGLVIEKANQNCYIINQLE